MKENSFEVSNMYFGFISILFLILSLFVLYVIFLLPFYTFFKSQVYSQILQSTEFLAKCVERKLNALTMCNIINSISETTLPSKLNPTPFGIFNPSKLKTPIWRQNEMCPFFRPCPLLRCHSLNKKFSTPSSFMQFHDL